MASISSDWTCRRCAGPPDHAQDFECVTCGWAWSVCQSCSNLVPLFRDELGREARCDACGPSEASHAPDPNAELGQKMLAVLTGLADGRNAMSSKSGIPWERHSVITRAWRASGSPKRSDPGWDAWGVDESSFGVSSARRGHTDRATATEPTMTLRGKTGRLHRHPIASAPALPASHSASCEADGISVAELLVALEEVELPVSNRDSRARMPKLGISPSAR